LLCYALWLKNESVSRAVLFLVVIVGAFAAVAYFSGEPTEEAVEHLPGIAEQYIEEHEEKAKVAFGSAIVTSIVGLAALLASRRRAVPRAAMGAVLVANLFTSL